MSDYFFDLALHCMPHISPQQEHEIIDVFGTAEAFFQGGKESLSQLGSVGASWANEDFPNSAYRRAEKEIEFIEKKGLTPLIMGEQNYPQRLSKCVDAPRVLFSYGNVDYNCEKIVAVVGTRRISDYGRRAVANFIHDLSVKCPNALVVSGLAYGVDCAAHKASLSNSLPTVGVLAHGLDTIYPAAHRDLARQMSQTNGAVLTEFLTGSQPLPFAFLQRNRIIAGLSDVTVVVESAAHGGSLNTARYAQDYNRTIVAFPGRIGDKYSEGCNFLISRNMANIYTTIDDFCETMNWGESTKKESNLFTALDDEAAQVLAHLTTEPQHIDLIAQKLGWQINRVQSTLTMLVFDDIVLQLPGDRYMKI